MRYAKILRNDCVNGEDVCVSLWTQGCNFHCDSCHNQCLWDFNNGIEIQTGQLIDKILKLISMNGVQRNFSVLGGEPLCDENILNIDIIITIVRQYYPNIKIFLWTGYTKEELENSIKNEYNRGNLLKNILKNIDYLIEGRYIKEQRDLTLKWRGSANQRILTKKELGEMITNE